MHRNFPPAAMIVALLVAATGPGCAGGSSEPATVATMTAVEATIPSRGTDVPVTVVRPQDGDGPAVPLVVMAHGHGGSRDEGGGFSAVAEALAERGIASIRMDFPGCGDSRESFTANNLSNMLEDLRAARSYAATLPGIDSTRTGILGYSMGGRLAALLSDRDPGFDAMVLWAPAVADGAGRELTEFGASEYERLKRLAHETGRAEYTTRWGTQLVLGPQWFADIEQSRPLDALSRYPGPLLVIYGDKDEAVPAELSASAARAATQSREVKHLLIPGARHGLGFYTDEPDTAALVVKSTADFFHGRL